MAVLLVTDCRFDLCLRARRYVEQQDIHSSGTTVREALQFSARLRLPADVAAERVRAKNTPLVWVPLRASRQGWFSAVLCPCRPPTLVNPVASCRAWWSPPWKSWTLRRWQTGWSGRRVGTPAVAAAPEGSDADGGAVSILAFVGQPTQPLSPSQARPGILRVAVSHQGVTWCPMLAWPTRCAALVVLQAASA
jgi:hypothetical protein